MTLTPCGLCRRVHLRSKSQEVSIDTASAVKDFALTNINVTTLPSGDQAFLGVLESVRHPEINGYVGLARMNGQGRLIVNQLDTRFGERYYSSDVAAITSPLNAERRFDPINASLQLAKVDQQGKEISRIKPLTVAKTEQEAPCPTNKTDYNQAKIREVLLFDDDQGFMSVLYPIGACYTAVNIEHFSFKDPGKQIIVPRGGEFPVYEDAAGIRRISEGPMGRLHIIKTKDGDHLVASQGSPAFGLEEGIFTMPVVDAVQGKDNWKIAVLSPKQP